MGLGLSNGTSLGLVHQVLGFPGLVVRHAGARRNQSAHDHVLFQAAQLVSLAHDGRFGQDTGGLLEGRSRDEAVGRQRSLRDAQEQVAVSRRDLVVTKQGLVGIEHLRALHLLTRNVGRVASVLHHHTAKHLTHNHFNVLVVDLHTLQTVHVLHFVNDVPGKLLDPQEPQDVLWVGRSVHHALALVDHLTLVDQNVFLFGHQFFPHSAFWVRDLHAHLAFGLFTKGDGAGHLGQNTLVFWTAGFKELGHTGQTTGDVTRFLTFNRNTCKHFAWAHILTIAHLNQGADLETNGHRVIGTRNLHLFAQGINQFDLGTHDLDRAAALGIDHHQGGQARHLVELLGNGQALFHILKTNLSRKLGDDRTGQGVPVRQNRTGLDLLVGLDREGRTVRHLVALTLASIVIVNDNFTRSRDHHQLALGVGHIAHRCIETDHTVGLGLNTGRDRCTRSRTPNVERSHGQLCPWLTDGLRSNHTHCLTNVDQATATQVTSIALGAQAKACGAIERCSHFDLVHT